MEIYWIDNCIRKGPLALVEVIGKIRSGELKPEMLGWHKGIQAWVPLKKLPALASFFEQDEVVPPPLPSFEEIPAEFVENQQIMPTQVACKTPAELNVETEWVSTTPRLIPRLLARFFDLMLSLTLFFGISETFPQLGLRQWLFEHPITGTSCAALFFAIAFELTFFVFFGTTPGKILAGIDLSQNGKKISFGAACLRSLIWLISLAPFGIGLAFYIYQCWRLKKAGTTWWDSSLKIQVNHKLPSFLRSLIFAAGLVLSIHSFFGTYLPYANNSRAIWNKIIEETKNSR